MRLNLQWNIFYGYNISICIIDKYFDFINLNLSLEITQSNVYDCQLCKLELHLKNCQSNDQTKTFKVPLIIYFM